MKSTFLLNIVIRQGSSVLQLLSSKDQSLLIWRNPFLVLNLRFHILNSIGSLYFKSYCLPSQSLHKDLHSTSQSQHKMKSTFFLNVIIRKSSSILQLFPSKDEPLLIWRNPFLVLDLSFHILDSIGGLYFKSYCLPSQSLDKDLHSTSQSQYKMKGAFLLDIVVRKCSSIFQLFPCEYQSLLIWRNSFLVLNLRFDIFNGIRSLHFEGYSFPSKSLHEYLHTASFL